MKPVCSVTKLPPEILADIFVYSLPERPMVSLSSPPILLTAVCKSWRDIAERYSQLWTRLFIQMRIGLHPMEDSEEVLIRKGAAICRWLEFAPATMSFLSVSIVNTDRSRWETPNAAQQHLMQDIMRPILSRICSAKLTNKWKTLVLGSLDEPYRSQIMSIPANELRSLQSLECWATSEVFNDVSQVDRTILGKSSLVAARALTSLRINSLLPTLNLKDYPLANWDTMTELHVRPSTFWIDSTGESGCTAWISFAEVLIILDRCKSTLTSFTFTRVLPGNPFDNSASKTVQTPPAMTFPSLRQMTLRTRGVHNLSEILALFKVPSLVSLDILDEEAQFTPFGGALFSLLHANPTVPRQLERLTFNYDQLGSSALETLFGLFGCPGTRVKNLSVLGIEPMKLGRNGGGALVTRDLLAKLVPHITVEEDDDGSPPPLFPCLETFNITAPYHGEVLPFDFVDLIASRITAWWRGGRGIAKLRKCDIQVSKVPPSDDFHRRLSLRLAELGGCPSSILDDVDINFYAPYWR
ncbi:hypothetical protein BKA70DRAFT_1308879 [Coprinopsis sp. MPI-PUGE-AT-0042]|nr:hypothetical protein BKA70DRAFT_1308879 [Coprinopsis sp. MPI-PUGE-AT-0042]